MKRRFLLISIALCVVAAGGLLLVTGFFGRPTPQLRLLGFTNAPGSAGPLAVLCFSNSTRHAVYLTGPGTGSPFFSREVKTAAGWRPAEVSTRPNSYYDWKVTPGQTCVFHVPALTNQPAGWRVTVGYFDGAEIVKLPVWPRPIRLPWKGSGLNLDVSTDTITQTQ